MFSFEYLHSYISIWLMTPMLARNMALNFLANSGVAICLDCFTSHVGEHRTVRGLWKRQGIPCFFKIPTVQQSAETEMPFVYVTLATHVTLATAGYTPCLFVYVTIGLARHNRTHVSQSERLLVKPQRPWTDLCAERVGLWSRLQYVLWDHNVKLPNPTAWPYNVVN